MVNSPCEHICKYNENKICIGCYRSKEEISKWLNATDEEKLQILENCNKRRKDEDDRNRYEHYA
jgi:predicted Fe-S protein YdhL (DUF1289 family)